MSRRFPLVRLNTEQWVRLLDFGVLVATVCFLLYVGLEVYFVRGVDFRGYYAASRVALAGGDPYDYRVVAQVLLDVTGEMGNNPYYYPPWFCLMVSPLALLPFRWARLIWIGINLVSYWLGAQIALDVLDWQLAGWRRWLVMLSGAYLFFWLSMRSEQLGTFLFLMAVLSLWGYRHKKPWLAGTALALMLTKPNVTWLTVPFFGLFYLKYQRRAAWWALGVLVVLLVVSTAILPGWYVHLAEPGFGAGLTQELDGPDQVKAGRLNTVLSDWLRPWHIEGTLYWIIWSLLAIGSGVALVLALWRDGSETYLMALVSAVGLLLTPYALQYDYPPLLLGLFWVYQASSGRRGVFKWAIWAILAFVFSVPIWEHPVYEGYWMLLGVLALLVALNGKLWRRTA